MEFIIWSPVALVFIYVVSNAVILFFTKAVVAIFVELSDVAWVTAFQLEPYKLQSAPYKFTFPVKLVLLPMVIVDVKDALLHIFIGPVVFSQKIYDAIDTALANMLPTVKLVVFVPPAISN